MQKLGVCFMYNIIPFANNHSFPNNFSYSTVCGGIQLSTTSSILMINYPKIFKFQFTMLNSVTVVDLILSSLL